MKYTKPEINSLGDAVRVIQFTGQKDVSSTLDAPVLKVINPAYDLDE